MNSLESKNTQTWVRPIPGRNQPTSLRIFYFPYAGAGASTFRHWGSGFPGFIEAFAVQLPGREDRFMEEPFSNLDQLLDTLTPGLLPFLDRPFAFYGHSMGAIICWELSRELQQRQGIEPVHVFVSGCRALHLHESRSLEEANLSDDRLVEELRNLNGTPEDVLRNPEFLDYILPPFRADLSLFADYTYQPGELLTCPVTAFGGSDDPRVAPEHLEGWKELTTGSCRVEVLSGSHFFLHDKRESIMRSMARDLSANVR